MCYLFFLNSVLRPFQDYFSSYETGKSVGGQKRENTEKNHWTHPQAELGLSHMWGTGYLFCLGLEKAWRPFYGT